MKSSSVWKLKLHFFFAVMKRDESNQAQYCSGLENVDKSKFKTMKMSLNIEPPTTNKHKFHCFCGTSFDAHNTPDTLTSVCRSGGQTLITAALRQLSTDYVGTSTLGLEEAVLNTDTTPITLHYFSINGCPWV